jgi:hypothetical protein
MSKGSSRRPTNEEAFQANFERIFGKRTGWPDGMLQDDSKELSRWLSSKPDALKNAREAVELISKDDKK